MQLVDELSMIYTTCLMCYVTFSFGKTSAYRSVLASSLVGLSLFITLYYHVSEPDASQDTCFSVGMVSQRYAGPYTERMKSLNSVLCLIKSYGHALTRFS